MRIRRGSDEASVLLFIQHYQRNCERVLIMTDFLCDLFVKVGLFNHCALPIVLVLFMASSLALIFIPKGGLASFAVVGLMLTLGMSAYDGLYLKLVGVHTLANQKTEVRVQQLENGRIHRVDVYVVNDENGLSTRLKKVGK